MHAKALEDDEEIQVPQNIQEMILRGIRTLSNSLSNIESSTIKSNSVNGDGAADRGIKVITLNKLLEKVNDPTPVELKELREKWYTNKELKDMQSESRSPLAKCNNNGGAVNNTNVTRVKY